MFGPTPANTALGRADMEQKVINLFMFGISSFLENVKVDIMAPF